MANNHGQGDSTAQDDDYIQSCGASYGWQTWKNQLISENAQDVRSQRAGLSFDCRPLPSGAPPAPEVEFVVTFNRQGSPSGTYFSTLGVDWPTVRDASAASGLPSLGVPYSYPGRASFNAPNYQIYRTEICYDISSLSTESTIVTAGIFFDKVGPAGNPHGMTLCAQGTVFDPDNVGVNDYDNFIGNALGTVVPPNQVDTTYFMEFNEEGIEYIQNSLASGTLFIMLREYHFDYLKQGTPTEGSYYVHHDTSGDGSDFVLHIGYAT